MENTLYKHICWLQAVWFIIVLASTLYIYFNKGTSITNTMRFSSENVKMQFLAMNIISEINRSNNIQRKNNALYKAIVYSSIGRSKSSS